VKNWLNETFSSSETAINPSFKCKEYQGKACAYCCTLSGLEIIKRDTMLNSGCNTQKAISKEKYWKNYGLHQIMSHREANNYFSDIVIKT